MSPALRELIQASYLSDDEKRELRVRHGLWTIDDVTKPRLAAKAALIRGAYDDASLRDVAADAEDRAEAMLFRGEVADALKVLGEMTTARAIRLRAQALIDSGKIDEASVQLDALLSLKSESEPAPGDADVEIARAALMRLRLQTANSAPITGDEVEAISGRVLEILKVAREKHDRLGFAAPLLEAQVLAECDNHEEASQALQTARCRSTLGSRWGSRWRENRRPRSLIFRVPQSSRHVSTSLAGPAPPRGRCCSLGFA